jgi:hypothetical protein
MKIFRHPFTGIFIIFLFGLIPSIVCQFFSKKPVTRNIHIRNFRYGKEPSLIRCNRGDTLVLTFSSDDTGHSFYLEEFDVDAKVSPSSDEVSIFKVSDPTAEPVLAKKVVIVAHHPGILNYIVSRSNYKCHVWCGPMHAFEQGKLVILPNTLLVFSIGCIAGILFLWLKRVSGKVKSVPILKDENIVDRDVLSGSSFLYKLVISRWPQLIVLIIALLMIYVVILTTLFGTKMSGRNLGVLLMWAVWLFFVVALFTPLLGRIWCTICPLPLFADWIQRRSFFTPGKGKTKDYNNKLSGLFLKWPKFLSNDWPKLFVFMILATFSTTLIAKPVISGLTILLLLLVPTIMSFIYELRAFCRYLCPVSAFVSPYSRMSPLELRNKNQEVCDKCKVHYCQKGNTEGWACPYGINVGELRENTDCGLCFECLRTCPYNNVTILKRPFASEIGTRNMGQAWLTIALFTLAIVYSVLYEGHWPIVRDYVNILDKGNWDLFGIYTLIVWSLTLVIIPGILYIISLIGCKISGLPIAPRSAFLSSSGTLLPLGMMIWIAFVFPMLFANISFIIQSFSDPFGWGWDLLGTANTPWHQLFPRYIPIIQTILILSGLYLSLRNLNKSWEHIQEHTGKRIKLMIPMVIFLSIIATVMLFFFTN